MKYRIKVEFLGYHISMKVEARNLEIAKQTVKNKINFLKVEPIPEFETFFNELLNNVSKVNKPIKGDCDWSKEVDTTAYDEEEERI